MSENVLLSKPSDRNLSPAQKEILESGLLTVGFNCVLQMPTGSGKTWLAEQAIAQTLSQNKRAIYLTPLRALADELHIRWQNYFAPKQVGVFTGDYTNTSKSVSYQEAQLLVMTPEKLDACTRNWRSHWSWIPEVDLVIADEFHLLGDPKRGARLEGTLLRLMRLNPFVRILGMSATLGNRQELADWLRGVEYFSNQRPIPLEWKVVRYKRAQDKPDVLLREVQRNLATGGKSLIFVQSRRRAEWLAEWLAKTGLRVAHHHAGLNHSDRRHVEAKFRDGRLDVLAATATLEMGLNLPTRQVILYDIQGFNGSDFAPLSVNSVWQRAGRAGRPGLDRIGEVILLAPTWERQAERYAKGCFEPIYSGLSHPTALAEQIVTEVASGLCRTRAQLDAVFHHTLASRQRKLPPVGEVVSEMLQAGMLVEQIVNSHPRLRATKLGFIAVRHLIAPKTVLLFLKGLEFHPQLTFLDMLLLATSSDDCQPLVPVDFEQLDGLADRLAHEPSTFLELPRHQLRELLGIDGKRLLAAIQTALVTRQWTRFGDAEKVAQEMGCYAFEVYCLQESLQRLLLAMKEIQSVLDAQKSLNHYQCVSSYERIQALERMIATGLDEGAVTLSLISGIGAKTARHLKQAGISDIEELALADPTELAKLPRISVQRATTWIEQASEKVDAQSSAFRYQEEPTQRAFTLLNLPQEIEPYRLRRALELQVVGREGSTYRVTGGLDPHTVTAKRDTYTCDCPDFAKGHICKHILAVRMYQGEPVLRALAQSLLIAADQSLDLLQLWMDTPEKGVGCY